MSLARLQPFVGYAALVLALRLFDWDQGLVRAGLLVAALVGVVWLARRPRAEGAFTPRWLTPLLLALALAHLGFYATKANQPKLIDIATTTLAAGEALAAGESPYALPIDREALAKPGGERFGGYKYGPMTAAAYMPLGLPLGARGLLAENMILDLLGAAIIGWLGARWGRGRLAAALWLATPMVAEQLIGRGVTDPAAILPALLGLPLCANRPLVAGLLIGLSLSAKLMPGAAFLVGCLPPTPDGRRAYALGAGIGFLPMLALALWDPTGATANILLFNAARTPDSTSLLGSLPPDLAATLGPFARAAALAIVAGLGLFTLRAAPDLRARTAAIAIALILLILTGPAAHQNYMLWWLPLMVLLVASSPPKTPESA